MVDVTPSITQAPFVSLREPPSSRRAGKRLQGGGVSADIYSSKFDLAIQKLRRRSYSVDNAGSFRLATRATFLPEEGFTKHVVINN